MRVTVRAERPVSLGEEGIARRVLPASGGGGSRRARRAAAQRRRELPGGGVVQAGGHAVAGTRPRADRASRARIPNWSISCRPVTSRSAAARTAAASTTSRRSVSRAACARSPARPSRSTSSWSAADAPTTGRTSARSWRRSRSTGSRAALDRLLDLYKEQRQGDENLGAFFRRVSPAVATARLKDLGDLLPNEIAPEDYIDLGETQAFNPEVMEGECAS